MLVYVYTSHLINCDVFQKHRKIIRKEKALGIIIISQIILLSIFGLVFYHVEREEKKMEICLKLNASLLKTGWNFP